MCKPGSATDKRRELTDVQRFAQDPARCLDGVNSTPPESLPNTGGTECRSSKMAAMKPGAPAPFGSQLKALREKAGFTQEELATIAGLSVHAVSALERGERRRPHIETVRALSAALDLNGTARDGLLASARPLTMRQSMHSTACRCRSRSRRFSDGTGTPRLCVNGWLIQQHASSR
jgi:DNA-binding XRE family transcriptional regulator